MPKMNKVMIMLINTSSAQVGFHLVLRCSIRYRSLLFTFTACSGTGQIA